MIEFGGVMYYIDIDALTKVISPVGIKPTDKIIETNIKTIENASGEKIKKITSQYSVDRDREIDGPKYEIIRLMIETLIDYDEETDASLGVDRALEKTPLSYKLAFNTLYNYGILKEKE